MPVESAIDCIYSNPTPFWSEQCPNPRTSAAVSERWRHISNCPQLHHCANRLRCANAPSQPPIERCRGCVEPIDQCLPAYNHEPVLPNQLPKQPLIGYTYARKRSRNNNAAHKFSTLSNPTDPHTYKHTQSSGAAGRKDRQCHHDLR